MQGMTREGCVAQQIHPNASRSIMINAFTELNLHPNLVQAVSDQGYTEPTSIQSAVIPLMLAGQDVLGQAQTGTGKTAAFALPILQRLASKQSRVHVQALVLTPTRELATQVAQAMADYGRYCGVQVLAVYGGQPYARQLHRLRTGVDVVVGTPGRLLDLIERQALDLSGVRSVVLDEADEMLSMGFIEDIKAILNHTPSTRQTTLFSATLPPEIRRLADRYLRDPQSVTIQHKQRTVAATEQRYYLVNETDKLAALTRLFEVEDITSALIFVRTRVGTGELANELSLRGFPAEALNGDLSQDVRERVLNRFRRHQLKVLVATDVAARGLDIDGISHVFNYDLPQDPEAYVHRIGRTGRAGKTGMAISLLTPKEQWRLRRIETFTKQNITPSSLPTEMDIQARREDALLDQMMVWLKRGRCTRERDMVSKLTKAGYDTTDVAAAALKLARGEEKQRPIAPIRDVEDLRPPQHNRDSKRGGRRNDRKRTDGWREKGMVRLTLSAGKVHGARPNDVVATIAYHADIPGHAIGAIRIQERHTLVDVPEQFVTQVLAKAGLYQIRRRAVTVACA
ncbi:MAG: DEAD/DEAH box helicase [Candidatus Tectomicrobia bacterium]